MTEVVIEEGAAEWGLQGTRLSVPGIIRWRVGFSLHFSKDLARDESLSFHGRPIAYLSGRAAFILERIDRKFPEWPRINQRREVETDDIYL